MAQLTPRLQPMPGQEEAGNGASHCPGDAWHGGSPHARTRALAGCDAARPSQAEGRVAALDWRSDGGGAVQHDLRRFGWLDRPVWPEFWPRKPIVFPVNADSA